MNHSLPLGLRIGPTIPWVAWRVELDIWTKTKFSPWKEGRNGCWLCKYPIGFTTLPCLSLSTLFKCFCWGAGYVCTANWSIGNNLSNTSCEDIISENLGYQMESIFSPECFAFSAYTQIFRYWSALLFPLEIWREYFQTIDTDILSQAHTPTRTETCGHIDIQRDTPETLTQRHSTMSKKLNLCTLLSWLLKRKPNFSSWFSFE